MSLASLALVSGCHLVFPRETGSDSVDAAVVPCTPGEQPAIPGVWESGAVDGNGKIYIGYRDASSQRLFVQALDEHGGFVGIARAITDNPDNGETLRLFAQQGPASLSIEIVLDGFSAIVVQTISEATISNPTRLTGPGNQCTSAVSLVGETGGMLAAYRDEITSQPSVFNVNVDLLDAGLQPIDQQQVALAEFGNPQQIIAVTDGFLIHTVRDGSSGRDLVKLDPMGRRVSRVAIGGADLVTLVEGTSKAEPMLARSTANAVELVPLDQSGGAMMPVIVSSGGDPITVLAARATANGTLVLAQSSTIELTRMGGTTDRQRVNVDGTNVVARAVAEGVSGPIVVIERDAGADRELVPILVCAQ